MPSFHSPPGKLAPPRRSAPLTRVRATLITASQTTLRTRGLFDRYRALLDPSWRDLIVGAVATEWFPLEAGLEHLTATQALGMSAEDAFESGAIIGEQLNGFVLETLARLAGAAGATPWAVLEVYDRFMRRHFDGGAYAVERLGAAEACVELRDMPVCRYSYFRDSFRGANHAGLRRFSTTLRVEEVPGSAYKAGFAMRIRWE